MSKKLFITLVLILLVIILSVVGWTWWSRGGSLGGLIVTNQMTSSSSFPTRSRAVTSGSNQPTINNQLASTSSSNTDIILPDNPTSEAVVSQVSTTPVGQLLQVGQGTSTAIVFFERATGHLVQVLPGSKPFRLTNTTLPQISRAWSGFSTSSTYFIIRNTNHQSKIGQLDNNPNASTTSIFLNTEAAVGETPRSLMVSDAPAGVIDFAISPNGNQFAYAQPSLGGSDLWLSDWLGKKPVKIATWAPTQLNLSWPASSTLALSTKAANQNPGLLYSYNLKTKAWTRLLGGLSGLETLFSPQARYVLYSTAAGTGLETNLLDTTTKQIIRLPFRTLASKCTWNQAATKIYCAVPKVLPPGDYPDTWYRGQTSFNDDIWQLEISTRLAVVLFHNPDNDSKNFDATQLTLDEKSGRLYFVNKADFSLWSLSLATNF